MKKPAYFKQKKEYTCGPATLRMALATEGTWTTEEKLSRVAHTRKTGTDYSDIVRATRKHGFHCFVKRNARLDQALKFVKNGFPVIVTWTPWSFDPADHYSLLIDYDKENVILNDPYNCRNHRINKKRFGKIWCKRIMIVSKERIAADIGGKIYKPIEA